MTRPRWLHTHVSLSLSLQEKKKKHKRKTPLNKIWHAAAFSLEKTQQSTLENWQEVLFSSWTVGEGDNQMWESARREKEGVFFRTGAPLRAPARPERPRNARAVKHRRPARRDETRRGRNAHPSRRFSPWMTRLCGRDAFVLCGRGKRSQPLMRRSLNRADL